MCKFRHVMFGLGICAILLVLNCESCDRVSTSIKDASNKEVDQKKEESGAALINGVAIPISELNVLYRRAVEQFSQMGQPVADEFARNLRGSILRRMIDDEIIKQKAQSEGITVDRLERVEAIEKYKERVGGKKNFAKFLEKQKLNEEQVITTIINDLYREKLLDKLAGNVEPSEEDIAKYYQENQKAFAQPETVRARHILLKLSPSDPPAKTELVLKKAQEILSELKKPGVTFVDMVRKHSEGASIDKDGDVGFFSRGKMARAFENAAFNAPLNQPVGPIKSDFGYHIILVEEKKPEQVLPLAQVRDRVASALKQIDRAIKSQGLLSSLRKEANITIHDSSMSHEEYLREASHGVVAGATNDEKYSGDKN